MTRDNQDQPLALLTPEEERDLGQALRMAVAPTDLDERVNEQLIAAALADPLAPATDDELVASARLRAALEGGPSTPEAQLAEALTTAAGGAPLDPRRLNALVEAALPPPRRSNVVFVAFAGAVAVTAAAAAAALFVAPSPQRTLPPAPELAASRSTMELFADKFELDETTARVDRIAAARERDLRHNRYATWGVE